ncbi:hypothetical protein QNA08_01825 [Chelatococcus sp. SYSU_G07232]|uniref:Uncharacterized protein n=2 Tax=Chelatococcus albus TaxID=3047466 RepID=A0ABT7AC88_9HYPH|nr:hypothetical protein [Chelatococcus sp. SYSU_G07232]
MTHRERLEVSLACVAFALGLAAVVVLPSDPTEVAVVAGPFAPRGEAVRIAVAAGGLLVRDGGFQAVVITRGNGSDFVGRLRAAGAWLVLDPRVVAGCSGISRIIARGWTCRLSTICA